LYESPADFIRHNWRETLVDKKWLVYGGLILLGAMASGKILALPVLNKLPRF
jgi:hypothetical protein